MKNGFVFAMILAACADNPSPFVPNQAPTMLYTCYTHATCDGETVDQVHRFCAHASAEDYILSGDAAARDWTTIWEGACRVDQGIVVTESNRAPGQTCVDSSGAQATWGCRADCIPQYESCE